MTSQRGQRLWLSAAVLAAAAMGGSAQASALSLFYERSLMSAADARCGLFDARLASSLHAAQAQARSAALRGGAQETAVAQARVRAQARAAATPCNSSDLAIAAGRVRSAFEAFSRLQRMTYPGQVSDWSADRAASVRTPTWRLSQTAVAGGDKVIFGLASQGDAPPAVTASAAIADGRWPYTARLVMRDPARAPNPRIGGVLTANRAKTPLRQRIPPRGATRSLMAESRGMAEPLLRPAGAERAIVFRFPTSTAAHLAALDPREAVALELVFASAGRDEVRTAYLEIGDFEAGQAFLAVAAR